MLHNFIRMGLMVDVNGAVCHVRNTIWQGIHEYLLLYSYNFRVFQNIT